MCVAFKVVCGAFLFIHDEFVSIRGMMHLSLHDVFFANYMSCEFRYTMCIHRSPMWDAFAIRVKILIHKF